MTCHQLLQMSQHDVRNDLHLNHTQHTQAIQNLGTFTPLSTHLDVTGRKHVNTGSLHFIPSFVMLV